MNKKLLFLLAGTGFAATVSAQCVTPPAPTSAAANPVSVCSDTGGTTSLSAAVTSGNFIAWYDAPTGGNFLGLTTSTGTLPVTASTTTIYYAEELATGGSASQTFSYTGAMQFWVVPFGTDTVTLEAWGAQGNSNSQGVLGGLGGYATGKLAVTAGDTLWIMVGGGGTASSAGGYNGGGNGGTSPCVTADAGGGGGASDIRYMGFNLASRVLVGAGGGGAGGNRIATCGRGNGGGGGGGYFGGGGGAAWPGGTPGPNPTGGTQTAGGSGGVSTYATAAPNNNGQPGAAGIGGNGGVELTSNQAGSQAAAAGASGGGTTGGPGGYAGNFSGQSGAGGSSYFGTLVNGSTNFGVRTGNGQVVLTYQSFCPSSSRTPVTFIVNPLPVVTASSAPAASVCEGTSVTLAGSGAVSYAWSGPATVTDNTPFASTVASSGVYTVTGTDGNNCTNTATVNLTVNALPQVSITAMNTTICNGDTVMLSASGANAYAWSTGGTNAAEVITPAQSAYITVTGTDTTTGCANTDSVLVTVNPLPSVAFTVSDPSVCIGSTAVITASGGSSYLWSTGDTTAVISVAPTVATVYNVSVIDSNGCAATDSIAVSVDPLPVVAAAANFSTICAGASVELSATGANTWLWSTGGTAAQINDAPASTTTYTVTGTDSLTGCSNTATVTVNVNPLPTVTLSLSQTTVCLSDGAFTLTGGSPAGGTWSGPGVSGSTFTPATAGTGTQAIVYTFTDANQCTANSTANIVVSPCVGITEVAAAGGVLVYPNPAGEFIQLKWNDELRVQRIEITDVTGRVVLAEPASTGNALQINLSTLPQGVYTVQVIAADGMHNTRIIKH
jgi:Glycine rich protein/Secretion system C-terminal sorting domain/Ig-like domain CHU_C associated